MKKKIEIYQLGHLVIRAKSKKVKFPLDNNAKKIIVDLRQAMTDEGVLVGISAPQIGISKKILITHPRATKLGRNEKGNEIIFINPTIKRYSRKKIDGYEGCGSVANANLFGIVCRSENIDVEYFSEDGEKRLETFSGFLAVIIQHEYDHLDGIVFTDRIKDLKSLMSGSEYKKMRTKNAKK